MPFAAALRLPNVEVVAEGAADGAWLALALGAMEDSSDMLSIVDSPP